TVVDATNVQRKARESLIRIAKDNDVLTTAIVLSPHPATSGVDSPDGRHAAEVFLELSTVPGAPGTVRPPENPQAKRG
ncbi:hypothetical protein, partial [Nocardiopsis alba]|uniref:hypothetical protein n=1 Tax=Nocardiopsis alba TaxID=53437 RepID=UPI0033F6BCE6